MRKDSLVGSFLKLKVDEAKGSSIAKILKGVVDSIENSVKKIDQFIERTKLGKHYEASKRKLSSTYRSVKDKLDIDSTAFKSIREKEATIRSDLFNKFKDFVSTGTEPPEENTSIINRLKSSLDSVVNPKDSRGLLERTRAGITGFLKETGTKTLDSISAYRRLSRFKDQLKSYVDLRRDSARTSIITTVDSLVDAINKGLLNWEDIVSIQPKLNETDLLELTGEVQFNLFRRLRGLVDSKLTKRVEQNDSDVDRDIPEAVKKASGELKKGFRANFEDKMDSLGNVINKHAPEFGPVLGFVRGYYRTVKFINKTFTKMLVGTAKLGWKTLKGGLGLTKWLLSGGVKKSAKGVGSLVGSIASGTGSLLKGAVKSPFKAGSWALNKLFGSKRENEAEEEKKESQDRLKEKQKKKNPLLKLLGTIGSGLVSLVGFMPKLLTGFGLLTKLPLALVSGLVSVLSKIPAIGGAVASVAGSLISGAGTALATGGRVAATLLTGPVGWAVGLGTLAYGGYKLYKHLNRNELPDTIAGKVTELRLVSYGISSLANKDLIGKAIAIEEVFSKAINVSKDGTISIGKLSPKQLQEIYDILGKDPKDRAIVERWLEKRFVPAFGKFYNVLSSIRPNLHPGNLDSLKLRELRELVSNFDLPTNILNEKTIPDSPRDNKTTVGRYEFDTLRKSLIEKLDRYKEITNVDDDKQVGNLKLDGSDTKLRNKPKFDSIAKQKENLSVNEDVYSSMGFKPDQLLLNLGEEKDPSEYPLYKDYKKGWYHLPKDVYGDITKLRLLGYGVHRLNGGRLVRQAIEVEQILLKYARFNRKTQTGSIAHKLISKKDYDRIIEVLNVRDTFFNSNKKVAERYFVKIAKVLSSFLSSLWLVNPKLQPGNINTLSHDDLMTLVNNFKLGSEIFSDLNIIDDVLKDKTVNTLDAFFEMKKKIISELERKVETEKTTPITEPKIIVPVAKGIKESKPGTDPLKTTALQTDHKETGVSLSTERPSIDSLPDPSIGSTNVQLPDSKDFDYKPEEHGGISAVEAIKKASEVTGVPEDILANFAKIESALNPIAKASTSSASGLYQFIKSTWKEVTSKHGGKYGITPQTSPFDPLPNAIMGGEFLKSNMEYIKGHDKAGIPLESALYLAHFLGPGGAKNFIRVHANNPNSPISHAVSESAINANRSIMQGKTTGQFVRWVKERFDGVRNKKASAYIPNAKKVFENRGIPFSPEVITKNNEDFGTSVSGVVNYGNIGETNLTDSPSPITMTETTDNSVKDPVISNKPKDTSSSVVKNTKPVEDISSERREIEIEKRNEVVREVTIDTARYKPVDRSSVSKPSETTFVSQEGVERALNTHTSLFSNMIELLTSIDGKLDLPIDSKETKEASTPLDLKNKTGPAKGHVSLLRR